MRKVLIIFMLVFTLTFITACSVENTETGSENQEEKVVLERYGMFTLQEYQFQKTTITNTSITFETFDSNMNRTGITNSSISQEQYNKLINNFDNFTTLDKQYNSQINIADIGAGNITYQGYEIKIDPYTQRGNPQEIAKIITALNRFVENSLEFENKNNTTQ